MQTQVEELLPSSSLCSVCPLSASKPVCVCVCVCVYMLLFLQFKYIASWSRIFSFLFFFIYYGDKSATERKSSVVDLSDQVQGERAGGSDRAREGEPEREGGREGGEGQLKMHTPMEGILSSSSSIRAVPSLLPSSHLLFVQVGIYCELARDSRISTLFKKA